MSRCAPKCCAVVRVHERFEAVTEHLRLGGTDHRRDRLADIPAAVGAENEHQVGGRGDETAEVGRLAPRRDDERPAKQKRCEQAEGTENRLDDDQMIDVVIVGARDRASRIEGDVRSQRREHPQPSDRVDHAQLLVRA